jgi:hypothetical protein
MTSKTKFRAVFWGRMSGWLGTSVVIPIAVFASKFGLFKQNTVVVDSLGNVVQKTNLSLNGWGIVCCLIVGSTVLQILKEVVAASKGYSLAKQCYDGLAKLMPLVIAYCICYFLHDTISQAMFCLGTLIACRAIAIPLNPLPKWRYEKTGVENYADLLDGLIDFVKNLKNKEGS